MYCTETGPTVSTSTSFFGIREASRVSIRIVPKCPADDRAGQPPGAVPQVGIEFVDGH